MSPWPWTWDRRKQDLSEELEAHLRFAVEDRIARGETPEQARAAAVREMGNIPLVSDVARQQWGWQSVEHFCQDIRYAIRQLCRSPGYTVVVILTLTLVVGANTAIFGLLYGLLLRSLPVAHPDQIVQIKLQLREAKAPAEAPNDVLSDAIYDTLAAHQSVFSGMCLWQQQDLNLREQQGTHPVPSASVSGGCFEMFGLHAAVGRLLNESDDRPGEAPYGFPIVLSYSYWQTRFGGDPGVIGRVVEFGAGFRAKAGTGVVVGVMQREFTSLKVGTQASIFVPSEMTDPVNQHNFQSLDHSLFARLRDGITMQQADAQIDTMFNARLKQEKQFPYFIFDERGFRPASEAHLVVGPGRSGYSYLREQYAKSLYLIEGMVGLSLVVACAYLAMLASARGIFRRRELAVRIALGF